LRAGRATHIGSEKINRPAMPMCLAATTGRACLSLRCALALAALATAAALPARIPAGWAAPAAVLAAAGTGLPGEGRPPAPGPTDPDGPSA
jgi:hypothetical protein